MFVSLVAALPRYPPRLGSTSPVRITTRPEKQVVSPSYVELITIATSSFSGVLLTYGSLRLPLSSLWNVFRSGADSPQVQESTADALSMMLLPSASHPSGHGMCAEDQFWFGPKQTCVGGTGTEDFIEPPAGYYCPVDWSFSHGLGCCMPHTPLVVSKNDCRNGSGSWDSLRIACVERGPSHTSRSSSVVN
ncbi:hypothetical protein RSOLAG1IB_06233 [Rhizoctonia solani AG-1 IB]|uniref:Uncharacterized protein n=1 Tax=Thanatephorus cucumeris (strain AG1-IB / isolate 7/3/14) TaxID=1108050 RepID=A0A0B7F5B7_THACB|nr:hypothetical protein RSOLAG1IB_06233 [Rhizoctonia solani AG-1 IB]